MPVWALWWQVAALEARWFGCVGVTLRLAGRMDRQSGVAERGREKLGSAGDDHEIDEIPARGSRRDSIFSSTKRSHWRIICLGAHRVVSAGQDMLVQCTLVVVS